MASSEGEDFESADEGSNDNSSDNKERRKRNSSSNSATDKTHMAKNSQEPVEVPVKSENSAKSEMPLEQVNDGWDDFEIDDQDLVTAKPAPKPIVDVIKPVKPRPDGDQIKEEEGWDNFEDWSDDNVSLVVKEQPKSNLSPDEDKMKSIADRLSGTAKEPQKQSSWSWRWGVDSLVNTASAGISSITSTVSQGISQVSTALESGIGAPDAEEFAKLNLNDAEKLPTPEEKSTKESNEEKSENTKSNINTPSDGSFPFGSLLSGVTKFVETTSTNIISGGLDTLETIGKKTMEVLQDGDPGLVKKRAMLGLDPGEKVVLSQVLREAKTKADEEDRRREEKREAKEVHYETLFDDFEGLIHLEALEMLSKQVSMRIEEKLRNADPEKRLEIKETLQQVSELCEMPDSDDEEDEEANEKTEDSSPPELFLKKLVKSTEDLGVKLHFQPLIKQYTEALDWLSNPEPNTERSIYKQCVASLAHTTALSVHLYHKAGEMLLVKNRRATCDEALALTQMTAVLSRHVSELATKYTDKLNALSSEEKSEQGNTYITNIFLEAGNSSTYIQNAFQLTLPILQIGVA